MWAPGGMGHVEWWDGPKRPARNISTGCCRACSGGSWRSTSVSRAGSGGRGGFLLKTGRIQETQAETDTLTPSATCCPQVRQGSLLTWYSALTQAAMEGWNCL